MRTRADLAGASAAVRRGIRVRLRLSECADRPIAEKPV